MSGITSEQNNWHLSDDLRLSSSTLGSRSCLSVAILTCLDSEDSIKTALRQTLWRISQPCRRWPVSELTISGRESVTAAAAIGNARERRRIASLVSFIVVRTTQLIKARTWRTRDLFIGRRVRINTRFHGSFWREKKTFVEGYERYTLYNSEEGHMLCCIFLIILDLCICNMTLQHRIWFQRKENELFSWLILQR